MMRLRCGMLGLVFGTLVAIAGSARAETITVGSKNFTEQFIVAELYAGALEAAGYTVQRKINLGATLVAHEALRTGAIDLYPEYTGTGLLAVMKASNNRETDARTTYDIVKRYYETTFDLTWLKPSGVDNGNAIVVRPEIAKANELKTLSDLAKVSKNLKLAAGSEFFDRFDGLPGLKEVYGMEFGDSRQFAALRLRYDALASSQADVANGFSTDWQIAARKFVALEDDKHLFPPYQLAAVVRPKVAGDPKAVRAIEAVGALIDNPTVQELNRQVEVDKKEPRRVAAEFLKAKGVVK